MNHISWLAFGLYAAMSAAFAQTESPSADLTPIFITEPFVNPKSLIRLRDYVAYESSKHPEHPVVIPQEFYDAAPYIVYWGYEFSGLPPSYMVRFRQTYDVQLLVNTLIAEVNGLKSDGCSYYHAHDAKISSLTTNQIHVIASIDGKQRACDDVLGSHDIGNISGSATLDLTFSAIAAGGSDEKFNGAFVAGSPVVNVSAEVTSIFGLNVNSVAGQIVGAITRIAIAGAVLSAGPVGPIAALRSVNIFDQTFWRNPSWSVNDATFALEENGSSNSKRYRDFMSELAGFTWSIQPKFVLDTAQTGFTVENGVTKLNVVFVTQLRKDWPLDSVREGFQKERDLFASFGKDEQRKIVGRDDSLWNLAKQNYGNPYYFSLLASANNLDRTSQNVLRNGANIIIPPLDKLTSQPNRHLMRPGETVWALCAKISPKAIPHCLRDIKRLNPNVPLSDVRFLEVLRTP
jgi:hypothetical protein